MGLAGPLVREHDGEMVQEQRRARSPDRTGTVVRGGVSLAWEVYGDGPVTVLLMPTWSIIPSRFWKLQIPYLARHFRVVTFDGRGSGRSGRPSGAAAYANLEYAADTVAVMDATDTDSAVLVALSCAVTWSVHVAADHPERVRGLFAIAPSCGLGVADPARERFGWDQRHDTTDGWAAYNKHHWLEGDYDGFRRFFFEQMFSEPHSTKQIEDCLLWSSDITARTLADTTAGRLGLEGAVNDPLEPACARVRCPVAVVHGDHDQIRPWGVGRRLAELTGGSFTRLEGVGHGPPGRHPVLVNTMVRAFMEGLDRPPARRTWQRALDRPRRVLYLSSPIGLGHARRDVAVAQELRRSCPGLQVDWLAQHPVTTVLEAAGERVHPASRWLLNESTHIEDEAGEHDLHAFAAIRRMDEILVNNFMVFDDVVGDQHYDLVVGDEAWDVDHFLHENPERKRFNYAWMTDFVGWLPMPDGGEPEARLTADHNAEMIEQRARFRRLRDRSVFVGNPDDIVDGSFGPGLPGIREWTEQNFDFAGYVTGFEAPTQPEIERLRRSLGYRPEHQLCVVTVGGSGVGESLLRRVLDAAPLARRLLPELRFLVVCGPRIDPVSLPRHTGVRVRGYLPSLHQHLAAADVAVVQGGLTTCMELASARTPFLYVPLEHHFEQNFHVRHRLERYGAGRHLSYAEACEPEFLAEAIVKELVVEPHALPVESDGAARAAALLAELL
ncbi:alpha/beta hydrolase [Nocardioides jensenii]|uniref:alpha/beta hydrolase n=1 Tax=Nocardioides jensenii TaxID=1843 RepID=UPI000A78860A|nr:alpha/beta fold hydrolase [Nocardioides jensenii]